MIRTLFYALLALMSTPFLGQQLSSDTNRCVQNYTIDSKIVPNENQPTSTAIISWDFSKTSDKEHLKVTLIVQPLNSCWKGLDGKLRSELKEFKILNISKNSIGKQQLTLTDLNAKCFKWQFVIQDSNTNCETKTEWKFISLL
ncbi:hypothetical protein [Winogradskyella psychrotolerans]|uniref:hypothetical protein n=1 Tax=Winogradskyella psychrotolerans TaxID=1344585 RepID=UPI001C0794ED|nr:hypothetical protein [Winogradskyella psychrotolerans]MBU2929242.1 hypothetical protein [Winogradskyella psychrotolerans]